MHSVIRLLKRAKNIALFSHVSPDPDAIGSALALKKTLEKIGKKVKLFCDAEPNDNYNFLEDYKYYNNDSFEDCDLFVSVDVASGQMLGKFEDTFTNFRNSIKIDHHSSGQKFAKNELVVCYSACAVLIFELIKAMKIKINAEIATLLYFGICGDTGIFRNTNTDSKTFDVCAKLLEFGADFKKVYTEFFDKKTIENVFLTSNALLNANIDYENKYAIMSVSKDDYQKFGASENENIGNLPNVLLNCGLKIAAILKQKDDGIHCSFRSKSEFDVSKIAEKFGGGGHKNASGCTIIDDLYVAERQVEKEIKKYLLEEN